MLKQLLHKCLKVKYNDPAIVIKIGNRFTGKSLSVQPTNKLTKEIDNTKSNVFELKLY